MRDSNLTRSHMKIPWKTPRKIKIYLMSVKWSVHLNADKN